MGCELGKLASSSDSKKCDKNPPSEPPPPAAPDPRLPLTARQKYSMVASWKGISRAMEPTGVHMFIQLFEDHSDLINLFSKFKELKTKEEQATSEELAQHATKVMETLDEGIRSLDDMDTFFEYLYQVGRVHSRIPGFTADHFWKIEKPFLTAVSRTLGDRYTENVENIYKISIKFVIETLIVGFNQSRNDKNSNSHNSNNNTTTNCTEGANNIKANNINNTNSNSNS